MVLTGDYKVAIAVTGDESNTEYNYALYPSANETFHEGDYAVAESISFDGDVYNVVRIIKIVDKENATCQYINREIICKIDITEYKHRKEVRQKRINMKKELDRLVKENKDMVLYEALAEKLPEVKKLLEDYKKLEKV